MRIVIEKITPVREGEAVIVSLSLSDEAHEEKCKHEIATDLFLDMGFPLSSGDGIEISQDGYEEIIDAAELTSAIKKGADFIGFAQNTKKSLVLKLLHKGFSRDISVRAADYLENVGYINEREQAEELFADLAERRLYGPSRIRNELYKKGFSEDVINVTMQTELDFDEILAERMKRTVNLSDCADKAKRQKVIASLMRYGYADRNIKNALESMKNEK